MTSRPPQAKNSVDASGKEWSAKFKELDSDIVFRSKDNVLFGVQRNYIDAHALGFPPSEFATNGEIIPLEEDGSTLELLFQFIYPSHELPDLDQLSYQAVAPLAEAAEKYDVSLLIYICRRRMRALAPNNLQGVLEYACKHHYPEIVGDIVPFMIKKPLHEVAEIASYAYFVAWARYIDNWKTVTVTLARGTRITYYCHSQMGRRLMHIVEKMGDLERLVDIETVFSEFDGYCCAKLTDGTNQWRKLVVEEIAKLPTFMDLLTAGL